MEAERNWKTEFPELHIPVEKRHFNRFAKRMKGYLSEGRYRDGLFYCRLGKPIDESRIQKYEAMCHKVIRSYFPALNLAEAAFSYDDLINMSRREVFLAILDGFDPVKALTTREADPAKRKQIEEQKRSNLDLTYLKSEESMVLGRLRNFARRERWKYSVDELGGSTVYAEDNANTKFPHATANPERYYEYVKDYLLECLENQGPDAFQAEFNRIDSESRENLIDFLREQAQNSF